MNFSTAAVPRAALWTMFGFLAWLLLVVAPLRAAQQNAAKAAAGAQSDWEQAQPLVQRLEDARLLPPPPSAGTQSLDLTVKGDLREAAIPPEDIHGVQQTGPGTAKVDFTQVPGDLLVHFLYRIRAQGLVLQQWDMTSVAQPGMWTASGVVASP
ncbi:MAG TPA: type II secretion system protein GspM [Candidatus Xenobia bacterium]|jgi:hypothetical protein